MMETNFSIVIDETRVATRSGETILAAARRVGIEIPTLCYLEERTGLESCGLCMVEVEGYGASVPACASRVASGMVVRTDTPALRRSRKLVLELLLSDHLGDCVAPCQRACPADIDIPEFLRRIRDGDPLGSLAVIKERVAFPGVLGRICPGFCERVCRRGEVDEPLAICSLKRYPADYEAAADSQYPRDERRSPTGKKVAIIGAGIVGLTAAYYLLEEGHDCVLYEAGAKPGGALLYIVPEFRLPKAALEDEIDKVVALGAEIRLNQALGRDFCLEEIRNGFDAVLLAVGATKEKLPEFPGSKFARSGLELLNRVSEGTDLSFEGGAVVFGSGPTAMDTSRTLLRLGASPVTLAMPASIDSSLFFKTWIGDGLEEGVRVLDRITQQRIEPSAEGKFSCRFIRENRPQSIEASSVFLAGHVEPDLDWLREVGVETSDRGIKVDRATLTTHLAGVFAAGNIAQAGRYAVQGSAAGHQAARSISSYLKGALQPDRRPIDVRMTGLSESEKAILFSEVFGSGRLKNLRHPDRGAVADFAEIDRGLPHEEARLEASRCLVCDCAAKNDCALRSLSTAFAANPRGFPGDRPLFERDASHDFVVFESGKCIKCGRCIAIAEERKEPLGLTYIGRGFQVKVGVPFNGTVEKGLAEVAVACAESCPTGALARKR